MASITLSETARLLNQFQERIDTLDRYINDKMREAIIKRDELIRAMAVIIAEAQS